jgi:hypothetical protein
MMRMIETAILGKVERLLTTQNILICMEHLQCNEGV